MKTAIKTLGFIGLTILLVFVLTKNKEIRQYTQYANLNNLFYEHFARDLYNEMKDFEIKFDTGICEEFRYLELDWSLVGATDQSVIHMLDNQNIEYELIEREVVEEE